MYAVRYGASLPSRMAKTFGERLKDARINKKGWSQDQAAESADMTPNYYARIERNVSKPSPKAITRLAIALDLDRADLGEPEPSAKDDPEDTYPARRPLLLDPEFKTAPEEVRRRVMGWPDAGAEWTTRQWFELFSKSLELHAKGELDPRKDPNAKPARRRGGSNR
jgi:transcriptional regulator with XRE-family HTH domain